jgi:hypothetical protein
MGRKKGNTLLTHKPNLNVPKKKPQKSFLTLNQNGRSAVPKSESQKSQIPTNQKGDIPVMNSQNNRSCISERQTEMADSERMD